MFADPITATLGAETPQSFRLVDSSVPGKTVRAGAGGEQLIIAHSGDAVKRSLLRLNFVETTAEGEELTSSIYLNVVRPQGQTKVTANVLINFLAELSMQMAAASDLDATRFLLGEP